MVLEAELKVPRPADVLWVSSAGQVVIMLLLSYSGVKMINIAVIECYYLSKPVDENNKPVRGYRRMYNIWDEKRLFTCNE